MVRHHRARHGKWQGWDAHPAKTVAAVVIDKIVRVPTGPAAASSPMGKVTTSRPIHLLCDVQRGAPDGAERLPATDVTDELSHNGATRAAPVRV